MGDGRSRRLVRFLLVCLRFIELFQRCLESMRDAALHRSHRLLSDDDRNHVPLCQLLVELAGTIEIARRCPVALKSSLPERTPAPRQCQCRLLKAWWIIGQECLDCIEGLSEVPLALQSIY